MTKSTLRAFTVACSIVGVSAAQRSEAQATFTSGSHNISAAIERIIPRQFQAFSQSVWNRELATVSVSASVTSATAVYSLVANSRQQVLLTGDQTTNQFTSVQVINTSDAFAENQLPQENPNQYGYARATFSLAFSISEFQAADLWFSGINSALGGFLAYDVSLTYSSFFTSNTTIISFGLSNSQNAPVADNLYRSLNLRRGDYLLSITGEAEARRSLGPSTAESNLNFDFRLNIPGPSTAALVLGPMVIMARRRR